jgi:regulator of sirC expression with transglutaminase-like and TPR domain
MEAMGSPAPTAPDARPSAGGFEALAALPDDRIDVIRGAALVARDEYPGLDVDRVVADLAALGAPLAARGLESAPSSIQAGELARHVFGTLGFRGNEKDYYDPKNSLISDVLARRLGIPITLAIVYCEVARCAGVAAHGVGFPGHFLVRVEPSQPGASPLFVDPFYAGRTLDEAALGRMIQRARGPDAKLEPGDLAAASPRAILVRVLTNLKAIHLQRADHARALLALDRIVTLTPGATNALKERGLVAARLGATEAARADLTRVLELDPQAADAAAVRAQLAKLAKARASLN